ncbi:Histone deacetylase complex subunit SAP18 [Heterocephalus glaber]|uniref:18 kDa Sin3-associated polypeptide n=1 Tax=Heterocephalus glaber TaxID=10181 RepID=G5ASH2_HETGA|nr:Histone deacetylase complex subunit SAP18 [Heterocephalus glaber]
MAVESRVTQEEEIKKEPEKPIDRERACPLLLRVFTSNTGRHHRIKKMAVESRVTQEEEIKKEPEKPIDRERACPLLLRVFTSNTGRHHRMDEFSPAMSRPASCRSAPGSMQL